MSKIYRHYKFNSNNISKKNQDSNLNPNDIASRLKNEINPNITKNFFYAKILNKDSVLLKKVMEHKKNQKSNDYTHKNNSYYPSDYTKKQNPISYSNKREAPRYYRKKLRSCINDDMNNLEDSFTANLTEQIPEKPKNKKNFVYGNYMRFYIDDSNYNTFTESEKISRYNTNASPYKNSTPYYSNCNSNYKNINDSKNIRLCKTNLLEKKTAAKMKNINQKINNSGTNITNYNSKVPYKKQLLHSNNTANNFPIIKKSLYMSKNGNGSNKNLRYTNLNGNDAEDNCVKSVIFRKFSSNQRNIREVKKNSSNNKNMDDNSRSFGFKNQSFQNTENKNNRNGFVQNQNFYMNRNKYPIQLIYSFVTHLNNYCYYYFTKILKIFFDGLKDKYNSKKKNFISVYQRFNYHKPRSLSISDINNNVNYNQPEFYYKINCNSSTLGNDNMNQYKNNLEANNRKTLTLKRNYTGKNNFYSSVIQEKIRESKSNEKRGESELCRNLKEISKKYEIIVNRKNRYINNGLNTRLKSEASVFDEYNSIDNERKTIISENKKKFDRNVERIRQRSREIKKIRQENERKKIQVLNRKISEAREEIKKLKQDKTNKDVEEKNKSSLTNKKIEINKKISKKNIISMITVKNIVTADKKIKIHMNYLNCVFPKVTYENKKNYNKLEIRKIFTITLIGENNNKNEKNSSVNTINRLYNKLSEIKEEEEVKEENRNDISKY